MSQNLSQAEVDAALALPADARYDFFIKQVVADGQVWGLVSDRGWSLAAVGEQACLALWPHQQFAAACALDAWADAVPQPLNLDQFKLLLEQLDQQDTPVAVFMTPSAEGSVVAAQDLWSSLWACLREELARHGADTDGAQT